MTDGLSLADISLDTEGDDIFQMHELDVLLTPGAFDGAGLSTLNISTTFNYNFIDADGTLPDHTLISDDGAHFAVITSTLLAASSNDFGSLLALFSPSRINSLSLSSLTAVAVSSVHLTAAVLNLLLHAVYGLSAAKYTPTVEDLTAAVGALETFGLSKEIHMSRTSPLFEAILSLAPSMPLECYKLAAHAEIEELAVIVSSYTLRLPLTDVTDEDVVHMGPLYTKRLFFLHLGRIEALKRILLAPPDVHSSSISCGPEQQNRLSRAWALETVDITWDLKPNLSAITLDVRMRAVGREIDCRECAAQLDYRIKRILAQWSLVKQTI